MYCDSFFLLGDQRLSPNADSVPTAWNKTATEQLRNGWGTVFFPRRDGWPEAFTIRGEVPPALLRAFCGRQAFIYFLEAWAQIISCFFFEQMLTSLHIAFCDNEASKHALIKAYGADMAINSVIALYWALHASKSKSPWMERVSSKANLSDAISRDDFTEARARNWVHLDNLSEVYTVILQCCEDVAFAHEHATAKLCSLLNPQLHRALSALGLHF